MRFIMFRTPKPKQFNYKPRYYDEGKEKIEQKKAEMGYESRLSHRESLRLQMSKRWHKGKSEKSSNPITQLFYYLFYIFVIFGGIYLIFFTDFVDKIVSLFGVGK